MSLQRYEPGLPSTTESHLPRDSARGQAAEGGGGNLLVSIWRRRFLVIGCFAAAIAVGIIYYTQTPKIYESISQVYIQRGGLNVGPATIGNSTLTAQVEIMRSTALINAALRLPRMQAVFLLDPEEVSSPLLYLKRNLTIATSEGGDLLYVGLKSEFPEDNAVIVNSIVESYIDYHEKKKRSSTAQIIKVLRDEKRRLELEYDNAMREALEYKEKADALSFQQGGGNTAFQRYMRLSALATEEDRNVEYFKRKFEAAQAVKDDPDALEDLIEVAIKLGEWPDDPIEGEASDTDLERQVKLMKREVNRLIELYGPDHTQTKKAIVVLEAMEAQLETEQSERLNRPPDLDRQKRYIEALEARYEEAKARAKSMHDQVQVAREEVKRLGDLFGEYVMLEASAGRLARQIGLIDTQINNLLIGSGEDTPIFDISILEPAAAGVIPVAPSAAKTFAIAILFGMMIGVGGALLLDWVDDRLRRVDQVSDELGLRVLGIVPHLKRSKRGPMPELVVEEDPHSVAAEAYRSIRTAMRFGSLSAGDKTILITSPNPREGKSTVASNLALAFAQAGRRTLLIDADCRAPSVHQIYDIARDPGLANVVQNRLPIEGAVQETEDRNLDLMAVGSIPANPTEMLNRPEFGQLLEKLAETYDHILIDAPPALAVSDAWIISAVVDATVMVVRANHSTRRNVSAAWQALNSVGGRVIGAILNDVRARRSFDGSASGPYGAQELIAAGVAADDMAADTGEVVEEGELEPRERDDV